MTSRSNNAAGFTLVEMLVVIAIVGLMTTLILSHGWQAGPAVHARAAAQDIANALREARSEAIARNRSVFFTLDIASHAYQWGSNPPQGLPNDLQLALLTSQDQIATDTAGRIHFDPDGGSSGGRVTITGGGQVWFVGIDWLIGHVEIATP
jgi:general secretion pathway protein H